MKEKIPEFLIEMLVEQYGENITDNILKGYTYKRPVTLRVNTIKSNVNEIKKEFENLKIRYTKISWYDDAFILDNILEEDIKKLEIYKNGKIYLQSLSSMLPPIVLKPNKGEDILDMAAAPGGKTTQIAALTKNNSNITACEMNKIRAEKLKYNINIQGASSVYVMIKDSRNIENLFSFDNILLDAPCSGSGTLNIYDSKIEKHFTKELIEKSTKRQITLLKKALKILKPGKSMVYSTCSILSCENEEIIEKVINNENVQIVPIELEGIEKLPLLPTKLKGTLCICPNKLYEGFFIAKIIKNK